MSWWRRQPLRVQLPLLVVFLGAAALLLAGGVAVAALNAYLLDQVDQQLLAVGGGPPGERGMRGLPIPAPQGDDDHLHESEDHDRNVPGEFWVAVVDSSGSGRVLSRPTDDGAPDVAALATVGDRPVTVGGEDGPWRVVARATDDGTTAFYAKSLAPAQNATKRLLTLEIVIGAIVLLCLALAAWFAVRRSLRPLADVESTAAAIVAGDLASRVPEHPPSTEVGQLATSFNTMLDEISATIEQRDSALTQSQASQARMRQFVADASHELRTPLTTIRGYSELYRQGGVPAGNVPETFGRIEGEAARIGGLVDDLLLLARLDQQRPLERVPVDLLQTAADEVHAATARNPERAIALRPVGDRVPVVTGDPARLRQVCANLIGNALKYSAGPVTVTVDSGSPGRVRLAVADCGPGIPDGEKPRLFERFYRGDPSRTRAAGGSGLGLSIVAAIVAAHDGEVTVVDNHGGGSVFQVALPSRVS